MRKTQVRRKQGGLNTTTDSHRKGFYKQRQDGMDWDFGFGIFSMFSLGGNASCVRENPDYNSKGRKQVTIAQRYYHPPLRDWRCRLG